MPVPEEVPCDVVADIKRVLHDIAPERAAELQELLDRHRVHVTATNEQHESPFAAVPATGEIRAYVPVLKRQLAMAFAYVIACNEVGRVSNAGGDVFLDGLTDRMKLACGLLGWAMLERTRIAHAKERWGELPDERLPDDLSLPDPAAHADSDDRMALELFYVALGADLHHELTHVKEGHGGGDPAEAVRQEVRADDESARWLIGEITEADGRYYKRAIGLALSHLYELFLKLEGHESDSFHPPLLDRLRRTLGTHVPNPDHPAWAFVVSALKTHLTVANRRVGYDFRLDYPTLRAEAEAILAVIAGFGR